MNSIYGEVRLGHSFFLGPIGLGNWPHFLDNGPLLSPWDVSSIGTFCSLRRPWDVLSLGRYVLGRFVCASSERALSKIEDPDRIEMFRHRTQKTYLFNLDISLHLKDFFTFLLYNYLYL